MDSTDKRHEMDCQSGSHLHTQRNEDRSVSIDWKEFKLNEHINRKRLNQILRDLADELDVPPSKYREAMKHHEAVGVWLGADDSELARYQPSIYPQGSFALGTAVKPLGDEEYDVDTVCLLKHTPDKVTQKQVKDLVGNRLKHPQSRYKDMIEPRDGGRRCWTIRYADASKFHLDVLPAIPDDHSWACCGRCTKGVGGDRHPPD